MTRWDLFYLHYYDISSIFNLRASLFLLKFLIFVKVWYTNLSLKCELGNPTLFFVLKRSKVWKQKKLWSWTSDKYE